MRIAILFMALAIATPSWAADMRIVCETRASLINRTDIVLPTGGEPVLETAVGDSDAMFSEKPRILSHVLTQAGPLAEGLPFSTIFVETKVTENGKTKIFTPQTYYVDWGRARVWKSFFSLLDLPGITEIENCVRVD